MKRTIDKSKTQVCKMMGRDAGSLLGNQTTTMSRTTNDAKKRNSTAIVNQWNQVFSNKSVVKKRKKPITVEKAKAKKANRKTVKKRKTKGPPALTWQEEEAQETRKADIELNAHLRNSVIDNFIWDDTRPPFLHLWE